VGAEDVANKEIGDVGGRTGLSTRNKPEKFGEAIDDNEECVEALATLGEARNEIHAKRFERAGGDRERGS